MTILTFQDIQQKAFTNNNFLEARSKSLASIQDKVNSLVETEFQRFRKETGLNPLDYLDDLSKTANFLPLDIQMICLGTVLDVSFKLNLSDNKTFVRGTIFGNNPLELDFYSNLEICLVDKKSTVRHDNASLDLLSEVEKEVSKHYTEFLNSCGKG